MATIDISFNTVSKEVSTFIDGVPIQGAEYITIDKYDDAGHLYMSFKDTEIDGMRFSNNLNASDNTKEDKVEHFLLAESDGHFHYYTNSSPFSNYGGGHFHGVVDGEVIAGDDHTHSLIKLDNVTESEIEIDDSALGFVFEIDSNTKGCYFKTNSILCLGTYSV